MRAARTAGALIALVFVVSGCGHGPKKITGLAAPITASVSSSPMPNDVRLFKYPQADPIVSLWVPKDWTPRADPNSVRMDFIDPSGQQLLRLDSSEFVGGSAISNWQAESEDFAKNAEDYQELGINDVQCPPGGTDCADWEFTFRQASDGTIRRVIDRAIVPDSGRGIALYFSAPKDEFISDRAVFDTAAQSMKFLPGHS